jgi:hypothetical protein
MVMGDHSRVTSPSPGPAPASGHAHRGPATEAMVSAALLMPTIVAFFIRSTVIYQFGGGGSSMFRSDVWNMALTAATDVYFIVVVAVLARTAAARVTAAMLGLSASILDLVTLGLIYYTDYNVVLQWIGSAGGGLALVLFVASWGVARRRRPTWYFGLIPTFIIAALISIMYQLQWANSFFGGWLLSWYVGWLLWVGAFVVGCLICWAFDSRSPAKPAPAQAAPFPPYAPYPPPPNP